MTEFFAQAGFTVFAIAFVVVGLPVILGIGLEAFKAWIKHKERLATTLNEQAALNAAKNDRLEERIRVLERIVTDRGTSLADQIEDLRAPVLPKPLN